MTEPWRDIEFPQREKRPVERLRLWDHDQDVTAMFLIEEHGEMYRITGPVELLTTMTVLEDASRARINVDRASVTEQARRAQENGQPFQLEAPTYYWSYR